ncbi:hypothetical protein C7399_112125 [Paraburkholderia tropica]|uniref:Uncharacterized protein n=1 Tax=Paraburkholderia tropica TaxID=92647 RepID=A0ABX5MLV0_9BURK|nr:hypothetical protein [Paraburkholderia tropica]PXX14514.1 hypothetical protein C7400_112126 [Paraburkholderia tropica]PZW79579.1 hypothetical protein C7399_112125 [Paraburkholderia tropica]
MDIPTTEDPKVFLLTVVNNPAVDMPTRIAAAAALMPYYHERLADDEEDEEQ